MIKRTLCLWALVSAGLILAAPAAQAQDGQVEAKPEKAQVRVGDVTLKRGLLAKENNTVAEARLLLKQMQEASAELTHVIQQRGGRTQRAAVPHLEAMKADLDVAIEAWERKLSSVGEDAQLANIELQNMLQKQQQTLQTMSNVSKAHHDTAMAIIRKIG